MGDAVVDTIRACLSCARVKARFRESGKELKPLPVRGLGYRWGVDFVGPLTKTSAGNKWVLVCIEHFTKWVELIPLPSKSSKDEPGDFWMGSSVGTGRRGRYSPTRGGSFKENFKHLWENMK